MKNSARLISVFTLAATLAVSAQAAELVTLHPGNFAEYAPRGKEADAIFGDYVLRNDRIIVAVADPTLNRGRSAGRKNVPMALGLIIDLTRRDAQNDLLGLFDPTCTEAASRRELTVKGDSGEPHRQANFVDEAVRYKEAGRQPQSGPSVTLTLPVNAPGVEIRYTLADGWDYIQVEMVYDTPGLKKHTPPFCPTAILYMGSLNVATSPQVITGDDKTGHLNWIADPWFGQAYGVTTEGLATRPVFVRNRVSFFYQRAQTNGKEPFALPDTKTFTVSRRLYPARDLFQLRERVNSTEGIATTSVEISIADPDGPVADARVTAMQGTRMYGMGNTDAAGRLRCSLPADDYRIVVEPFGRKKQELPLNPAQQTRLAFVCEAAARLNLTVTDDDGKPIPCKVAFDGLSGTKTPFFFPDSGSNRVQNLAYTADGKVNQTLAPGRYRLTITHGPEYDFAQPEIALAAGHSTSLVVRLARTMDTTGWISSEFGNRSTQSRPFSIASVEGRVLNLAAEQIEFAPACERDQVFTYEPVIRKLGLEAFIKSCPGIGLTERVRKTVTSQNAFPVKYLPGAQDGGAVQRPQHIYQVFWLNSWYGPLTQGGNSGYASSWEKLIQVTPPDIHEYDGRWHGMWQLFQNPSLLHSYRNGIEQIHRNSRIQELYLYNAMEVQPLRHFVSLPAFDSADPDGAHDIAAWQLEMDEWSRTKKWPSLAKANLDWLRMLNLGYRITGVVNNNRYHNFHGSGSLRNYVQIGIDDPAKIDPLDVVKAVKEGRVVMSSGPFLEISIRAGERTVGLGQDLVVPGGKAVLHARIQAQRGTRIDTVHVLFNGRPLPELTRTRATHPALFKEGTVQFDADIPLACVVDTRVMVLAAGRGPNLREVQTNTNGTLHVALSNPIYLDVDGDGFRPFPPWQDRVFTRMDLAVPLFSAKDAKPAEVIMKLKNLGSETATDTFSAILLPEGVVEVVGENRFSYSLAPGELKEIRIALRYLGNGKLVRISVPRSSAGLGRRATALTIDLDKKPIPPSRPDAIVEQKWWLPEHDPDRPANLWWPEFGR